MVALPLFALVAAFLALTDALAILASLAGVRMSQPLALCLVAIAALVAVPFAMWFRRALPAEPKPVERLRGWRRMVDLLLRTGVVALLLWALVVWLQLWVLAWHRSPLGWDELWYHIAAINEWTVQGGVAFHRLDPALATAPFETELGGWLNLPMGVELTGFLLYHLTGGSDRLIDAANLPYWPLAFTALVVIAGALGARGIWRWLAGALLFGVSLYVIQGATLYIDAGFGSAVIASLAAALVFAETGAPPLAGAMLLGMTAGLMIGAKGTGAPYLIVIFAAAAVAVVVVRGWAGWRREALRLALAALVAVPVGGYWYLRNAIHTGNPVYPIQVQLGHKVLFPGYDLTGYDRLDWIVRPVLKPYPPWARTPVAWLQRDLPIFQPENGPNYAPAAGLGFVWLLGGLPAMLVLLTGAIRRPREPAARRLLWLGGVAVALYLATTIGWQARFTFWLSALGLPALAVVASRAAAAWPRRPVALAVLLLAGGVAGVAVRESLATVRLEWRFNRIADPSAIRFQPAVDSLWPGLREAPGFDAMFAAPRLARGPWISTDGTLATGILALPLNRQIEVLPPEPDSVRVAALEREGIEWVFWEVAKGGAPPATLTRSARTTYRYDRYGDYDFVLVRLGAAPRSSLTGGQP